MEKVVDFYNRQNELEGKIEIPRSEKFIEIAQELSDFINDLPLTRPDNDKLIQIIVGQVKEAECAAFLFGFDMGVKIMKND